MTNKKLVGGILAILLIFGALMIGCSSGNSLVGTWVGNPFGGPQWELTFGRDGSYTRTTEGSSSVSTGTYRIDGSRLIIDVPGRGPDIYDFEVKGNTLSLTQSGFTHTYTRK